MRKEARVRQDWRGRTAIVAVTGEIDIVSSPVLESAVAECLAKQPAALIIDLSGTEFLASAGIGVLIGAYKQARHSGVGFSVVADGAASRPIELMNMQEILNVHRTVDEAEESVART